MKLEKIYQNEVNHFCELHPMPDGRDIFRMAQEAQKNDNNAKVVPFPMEGRNAGVKGRVAVVLVAILVMLLGTTAVAAATGYLNFADIIKSFFHNDETTTKIIEEGFYEDLENISMTVDNIKVELVGLTGDDTHPKIAFNVYVDDPRITENYDRIRVDAYVLDPETYANNRDNYATVTGYGERDETDHSVYHVVNPGYNAWMNSGVPYVFAISSMYFGRDDRDEETWYRKNTEMVFELTSSFGTYSPVITEYYNEPKFTYNGIAYRLRRAEYSTYKTFFSMAFSLNDASSMIEGMEDFWEKDTILTENYREMYRGITLEANGVSYEVLNIEDNSISYSEEYGEYTDMAYIWFEMPAVDFEGAETVLLRFGDQVIDLKDTCETPDYFYED